MSTSLTADERGSTTIVTAVIICFLVAAVMVAVTITGTTIASHKARNAADLAAIAGAHAIFRGDHACGEAAEVASANGAILSSCVVDGADVTVTVAVGASEASAKAGPI